MEGKGTWKDGDLIPTSRSHDQHPESKLAAVGVPYGTEVQVEFTWVRRDSNRAVGPGGASVYPHLRHPTLKPALAPNSLRVKICPRPRT